MTHLSRIFIFLLFTSLVSSMLSGCKNWDLPGRKTQRECGTPAGTLTIQVQERKIDCAITKSSGTIDQVSWDFGDNSTTVTTGLTVSHTYSGTGVYTLKAELTNTCGGRITLQQSVSATNPVVPSVSIQPVTGISTTSATVAMIITNTGNAAITKYGICWSSTNQMPTMSDPKTEVSGSLMINVPYLSALTGLQPNTTYYVRSFAVNSIGTGYSMGPAITFRTGQDPAVSTVAATNVGITTATANFIVTTAGNPAAVEYGICYSATTNNPRLDNDATAKPVASPPLGANVPVDLTNLTPNRTYYYRTYTKTASGQVIYGEVLPFTTQVDTLTQDLVASVSFTNQSLLDVSGFNNHVKLMGNPTFTADRNGIANAAVLLNGTGDYFMMPENSNNSLNLESFSISVWVKPSSFAGRTQEVNKRMQIFNKSRFTDGAFERYSAAVKLENDIGPNITFIANVKQGGNCQQGKGWQDFLFTSSASLSEWHHLVLTYSGRSARLYFDNVLLSTTDNLPADRIDDCKGGDLKFGAQSAELPWYFKGAMDDIRIYRRVLSRSEVQTLSKQ